jgi:uncharacterized repeat protein (TIGR01451 family)
MILILILLVVLGGTVVILMPFKVNAQGGDVPTALEAENPVEIPPPPQVGSQTQAPIIIDHTCTDLSEVTESWIEKAKDDLRITYGHTSHGSQPISGMGVLMADPSNGGLYDFNTNGAVMPDVLSLRDRYPYGDLGNPDRVTWASRTRDYLNGSGSDRNVVIWSWCGQVHTATEADINTYLSLMNQLEQDFPNVTFVYMTGHLQGTGETGNLHQRNEQIRNYVIANNKILFDFADIESYDPAGNYYLDRGANDGCYYSGGNWADEWCAANPGSPLCASCDCAHSKALNCNLKARAFWWMLARLAGWDGGTGEVEKARSYKVASTGAPTNGQTITYTIVIQNLGVPLTTTVHLSDVVPSGLSYLPGTLTATTGTVTETTPTLLWSGLLTPTPIVTVTYAVTVSTPITTPLAISNTAQIVASDFQTATTSLIFVNGLTTYLPVIFRD